MKSDETDDNSTERGQRSHHRENSRQRGVTGLTLDLVFRPADLPIDVGMDRAVHRSKQQPPPRDIIPMMTPTSSAPAIVPRGLRRAIPSSSAGVGRHLTAASGVTSPDALTCLLRARTGLCRQFERPRDLCKRCLLCFAYANAADAKKSALLRCLGNVLTNLAQPPFEGRCIAGRLGIDYR